MHMTSQKGAHVRWGSNEALPRAPSPSMQPAGQPLHAHTAEMQKKVPAGTAPLTERLGAPTRSASTTRARMRDKSWPPAWRRCHGAVTSMHKVYRVLKCDVIKKIFFCISAFSWPYFGRAWWKTSTHQILHESVHGGPRYGHMNT